ncbi:hypothetical protein N0B31_17590 [Salinirubellus salinus]|uniref:Uncharacterized protein n=1 Tax=Salinirubellus salinus TaxID=1364945 RepID=A0A9E7U7T8_9EURY|nr:hypothetical protein [Salinirubellus salinus]UWM53926.1 hypothetical protein N0B31_17590 [Salinirubellus salinus]
MAVTPAGILESLQMMVQRFSEVAMVDPVVAAMLTSGAIFVTVSVAVFGYLTLGAVVDALVSLVPSSRQPPSDRR